MSFIGSSSLWGDQSTARLCQLILEENDGMAQQIVENRHDLLDLLTLQDLRKTDDIGLSLQFLAIYYDRPDMLRYLRKRGIDLNIPCDPMGFGTPMFYAVTMGKPEMVEALSFLGCSVDEKCDVYCNLTPEYYAKRKDDQFILDRIELIRLRAIRVANLFRKNILRYYCYKKYVKQKKAILRLQKFFMKRLPKRESSQNSVTNQSSKIRDEESLRNFNEEGSIISNKSGVQSVNQRNITTGDSNSIVSKSSSKVSKNTKQSSVVVKSSTSHISDPVNKEEYDDSDSEGSSDSNSRSTKSLILNNRFENSLSLNSPSNIILDNFDSLTMDRNEEVDENNEDNNNYDDDKDDNNNENKSQEG